MLRAWIIIFVFFFILAEVYQWIKHYTLPVPLEVLGGAFLAIASNYEQGITAFFNDKKGNILGRLSLDETLRDRK